MVPQVGQIIAKAGAYNRKYKVVAITKFPPKEKDPLIVQWVVELKVLGSYYQDGRVVPPRKSTPTREILVHCYGKELHLDYYVLDSGLVYKG